MIDKNRFKTWRIGEEGASEVCDKNVQFMAAVAENYSKKCSNPYCRWPISALREENFIVPKVGEVCVTCHSMFVAVSFVNKELKNQYYFHHLQEEWEKQREEEIKKKKKTMEGGL